MVELILSIEYYYFFYQKFSHILDMNAVYISSYSIIAIHILLYYYNELNRYFAIVSIFLLVVFCLLLSSKMMLACLAFGIIFYGFQKLKLINAFALVISVVGFISLIILTVPSIKQRITTELQSNLNVVNQTHFTYDTPFTGTSLRLVFWKTSIELLNEKNAWLNGVHTGDFQDLLNIKYKEKGIYTGNPELKDTGYLGYGPHNQYIEILLSVGILDLLVFICLLTYYIRINILK
jgi:O-antigen ligase